MIRRLDAEKDADLFLQSWGWLETSPRWRQETEAVFGAVDQDNYFTALANPERIDIGVFERGEFTSLVTLTLRASNIYEVHLEAGPAASADAIIFAGWQIRERMFDYGMQRAYTWTPHWNRPVLRINKAIGFLPDNVSMFRGTCRNNLVEWVRYSLRRPDGR